MVQIYKTVSFSTTNNSVSEEFSELGWIFDCETSTLLAQRNITKIKSPRTSIPPAVKKAAGYELVLSATKPRIMMKKRKRVSVKLIRGQANQIRIFMAYLFLLNAKDRTNISRPQISYGHISKLLT